MKAVLVLQTVQEGRKDVTTRIIEHPLEHEFTEIWENAEKIKEWVKETTQQ